MARPCEHPNKKNKTTRGRVMSTYRDFIAMMSWLAGMPPPPPPPPLLLLLLLLPPLPGEAVNCGGHSAPACELCPGSNGAGWCNGECNWDPARTDDAAPAQHDPRCFHPLGAPEWRNCGAGGASVDPEDPVIEAVGGDGWCEAACGSSAESCVTDGPVRCAGLLKFGTPTIYDF
eukprot:SAG31_NODE_11336_length_1041_cov_1.340764_1_plen_174_part_00